MWTPVTDAPQYTLTVWVLPPLEPGGRDPAIPKKLKNGGAHPGCDYRVQAAQIIADSLGNQILRAGESVSGLGPGVEA